MRGVYLLPHTVGLLCYMFEIPSRCVSQTTGLLYRGKYLWGEGRRERTEDVGFLKVAALCSAQTQGFVPDWKTRSRSLVLRKREGEAQTRR